MLRWGHRPQRDVRLTTHVALTARALCASGFILSDTLDAHIQETVNKITQNWGGNFYFEMGTSWKKVVREWKTKGGVVVHLTAYGENIQTSDILDRIKKTNKDLLVNCWKPKSSWRVLFKRSIRFQHINRKPTAFRMFRIGDISWIGYFKGKELAKPFEKAKIEIVPKERGKEIKSNIEFFLMF